MVTETELEEVKEEIRALREEQQTLMNSLTNFADTVKRALTGALDRGATLETQVADIAKILANFQARLEALEKDKLV
jgi:sugar-specific transcriptional regulator TrmB